MLGIDVCADECIIELEVHDDERLRIHMQVNMTAGS